MINDVLTELREGINKAKDGLKRELSKVRTGRANADIFDAVRIDYYGVPTPMKQVASISVPEARMIVLKPFDRSQIQAIERAIRDGQLGLNPMNDGEIIRVPMPALSEERRKELVKVVKKIGEEAKVGIRKVRHDAKDMIETLQKEREVSEDDADRGKKEIEELIKTANSDVDQIVAKKEQDILVV